ncbi:MAG: DUF255 domain-containing protein [Planctomycetes bacterium]|nr:DUF255 domain-containing protein [Planctomycetota bacterium]
MTHRLEYFLANTSLLIAASTLIVLWGCEGEPQRDEPGTVAVPVAVESAEPAQSGTERADESSSFQPIPGHVPLLVDASRGEHKHTNRLIDETSPYLLQHAHNPVNWYPWGPEAFEAARREDKPIFISVGYSTCYWCHVMERESFENEQVAAYMNQHFIAIKIDREERPDVDDIYMAAVQALVGRGGWPMSVFLEPQSLKPFFGGTYFPKPRFMALLRQIAGQWTSQRAQLLAKADQISVNVTRRLGALSQPQAIGKREVDNTVLRFLSGFDQVNGGFRRGRPKFPIPTNLQLLMYAGWDNPSLRQALLHTLDRMAMGGIYDQIGGGFHRYSTDARWLVPHFEKMLYDNGQLASVYAEAFARTGDPFYAEVLRETLDYVVREMRGPEGRLYSAQDAEADEREGGSYIWTKTQVRAVLQEAEIDENIGFVLQIYGLNRGTNFQDPHHPEDGRKNVLFLTYRPAEQARRLDMSRLEFQARREEVNRAMLIARYSRIQPITDDKTLVAWNGLMIAGLADGGRVLNEQRYLQAANEAVGFILTNMRTADGGLFRTYRSGTAKIDGLLEDYAFFCRGLLALHRATGDDQFVQRAIELTVVARRRFWDDSYGGFFDTLEGQADLFVRTKSTRDGVVPSGNSVMIHNLLDLYEFTGDPRYLKDAAATLAFLSRKIKTQPTDAAIAVLALHRFVNSYPAYLPSQSRRAAAPPPDPVTITTSASSVRITPSKPGDVQVTLQISDGYHVNAHEPGQEFLIGLSVRVIGDGFEAEVNYPTGEPYRGPLGDSEILVHTGRVTLPIQIRRTGSFQGQPKLMIEYQVCTDKVCLAPTNIVLPITLLAASGSE